MGIFKEMYPQRTFATDWEYTELLRKLSEAIANSWVEQIPVIRPHRYSQQCTWYLDKETGEIYSLDPPEEKVRGWWDKVDPLDLPKAGERVQ